MSTSPLPIRFPAPRHTTSESAKKAADFESLARLVEDLIPNFKKEDERQFYREVGWLQCQHRVLASCQFDSVTDAPLTSVAKDVVH